jgi:hypothetical protein
MAETLASARSVRAPTAKNRHLTMRLSDAGMWRRQTKLIYPNHRLPPWLTEDATRDRSNRLLDGAPGSRLWIGIISAFQLSSCKEY